jgi:hypothetical protein
MSIIQDWVAELGLRHQGVLVASVRGCDDAPKDDPSKLFTRCYRSVILNAHCVDPSKTATFIQVMSPADEERRFHAFRKNLDHYPHHYVMHLTHAIEIVGYKHPDGNVQQRWKGYYLQLCRGLHVNPETHEQLDDRLNADETTFGRANS